ncbi:major facilitator superfamily domain-containing protein [Umbelopsis sp. PMI_123]|nr:major facilitator superfamily domain-containing protein [Umbelopsis sp. PMI_123]
MFNAVNGMGGAGQADPTTADNANTALSVTFTLCSLIGAPVYNIFGARVIIPAALCYVLYIGSYLTPNSGFTIATGALLGIGAGFLWTAQAGIMMSYPTEAEKGKFFATFWMIFNVGATMGAAIGLGKEWNSGSAQAVSVGTYIAFMCIMAVGAFLAIALLPPGKVIRADGTPVSLHKFSNWKRESIEILLLFKDWRMLMLVPLFAGSNWFYTYQFSDYNGGGFYNLRTRNFNNMFYWLFQIIGAGFFGFLLDWKFLGNRKRRAFIGNTFVLVLMIALWVGCIFVQNKYTRESVVALKADPTLQMDVLSPGYGGLLIEYALFGAGDAIYQGFIYWLMGTMTNDTERAARYGGFYKTIQNAANAIAGQVDAIGTPFMTELAVAFAINGAGLLLAYVVCFTIPDVTEEVVDNLVGVEGAEKMVGGALENEVAYTQPAAGKDDVEKGDF